MSGSARSVQSTDFGGLRVASLYFTPEYSKNGANISAKLEINAFLNVAGRQNNGEGPKDQIIKLTCWNKLAHVCSKSMSQGKEFNAFSCELRVFDKRVFMPSLAAGMAGTPVLKPYGTPLTVKAQSFTIGKLTFGMESDKHIAREIAANVRPLGWNVAGSQEALQWKEILKARQAIQFDPNSPTGTYGYATIRMPDGPGIGAYIPEAGAVAAGTVQAVAAVAQPIPATVAVIPAAAIPAAQVGDAVAVAAGGFIVPPGV